MKRWFIFLMSGLAGLFMLSGCGSKLPEIIAGGDDQVIIIDAATSDTSNLNIVWSWNAGEATGLPAVYKDYIRSVDDCKPVDNNSKILLTSSSGAAVVVERETKRTLFYAGYQGL